MTRRNRLVWAICFATLTVPSARSQTTQPAELTAALAAFDGIRVFDDADQWVGGIRSLSGIGRSAVPALTEKLVTARRGPTLAASAIALRVIGDRRAVPALIYALRRCQPLASDFGVIVPDPELHWFLWQHQTNGRGVPVRSRASESLSFGRSVREISETLQSLTGHTEGLPQLSFYDDQGMYPKVDATATYERTRLLINAVADRWQQWWEGNKQNLLTADELRWVEANTPTEFAVIPASPARSMRVVVRDQALDRVVPELPLDVWVDFDHYRITTDADGRIRVPLPEKIKWLSVVARREGSVPVMMCYGPDEPLPEQFEIKLPKGASIGGVVQDEMGRPIANAQVFVTIPQKLGDHLWASILDQPTSTGMQGRWIRADAPAELEACIVRVMHPDYQSEPWYANDRKPASATELREQRLVLIRPALAKIEGTLVDSTTNQPITNATISAIDEEYWLRSYPDIQTDGQGRFTLSGVYPKKLSVTAQKQGYRPAAAEIDLPFPQQITLTTTPARDALHGQVVDAQDRPVPSAIVALGPWHGHHLLNWWTRTDEKGNFTWSDAPEGTLQLRVYRTGFEMATVEGVSTDAPISIKLTSSLIIEGTVTDLATGQPVNSITVTPAYSQGPRNQPTFPAERGQPFNGGTYSIAFNARQNTAVGQAGKPKFIRIDADGYLPFVSRGFDDSEGHQKLDVQLQPSPNITGTIVDPQGKPVKDAQVLVGSESQMLLLSDGKAETGARGAAPPQSDEAGHFSLRPQVGDYTIVVLHDQGYGEVSSADFAQDKTIHLQPWGRIEVTATSGDKPAAGAMIGFSEFRSVPQSMHVLNEVGGETNENGILILDRVTPGHYLPSIQGAPRNPFDPTAAGQIDVKPGETVKFTFARPPSPNPQVAP